MNAPKANQSKAISPQRLWQSLMDLARIGATPKIGNIFARRVGRDPSAPLIMIGSHLDSQPTGGRFDGAYGVMSGLEVVRALNDCDVQTQAGIEIVCWANEEGTRFQPALMGSSVYTGRLPLADMLAAKDNDGISVGAELATDPLQKTLPQRDALSIATYLEIHIEQGPVLEDAALPLGIVSGVQGIRWYDIRITGAETHAGPTPMPLRHDALMGAAELALAFEAAALQYAPDGRGTVGTFTPHPGSRNVVPGRVDISGDLRHPDNDVLDAMETLVRETGARIAERRGITIEITLFWKADPVPFDPKAQQILRNKADMLGFPYIDMVSGAGHDAQCLGTIAPAAMLFIPCLGGVSHNEAESITSDQAEVACAVLYEAVLELAGTA